MAITAAQVKELRERTGAGMMDCKKALTETNGDIEQAIENMRKNGQAKAAKKAGRVAAEGVILAKTDSGYALMLELNCETDFVARDSGFLAFGNKVLELAFNQKIEDIDALMAADLDGETVEEARAHLVAKIGENINVRRIAKLDGAERIGSYVHGSRIGVLVGLNGGDEEVAKDLAMHIAASRPDFVTPEDVPAEVVEKEKAIQVEVAMNSGKPADIAEKMVAGRMRKFTHEISLTGQPFVKDPSISVGDLLKQHNATVTTFLRLEVGEGIEKQEDDFASEVQAQIDAAKK